MTSPKVIYMLLLNVLYSVMARRDSLKAPANIYMSFSSDTQGVVHRWYSQTHENQFQLDYIDLVSRYKSWHVIKNDSLGYGLSLGQDLPQ